MSGVSECWWRSKGFKEFPRFEEADGSETLYRVMKRPDKTEENLYGDGYFTLMKPTSVSAAEFNLNIVKWGNKCRYVASFSIKEGTPMWIGPIDQTYERKNEDDGIDMVVWGNDKAEQVWINPETARWRLKEKSTEPLLQDKIVIIPNKNMWH